MGIRPSLAALAFLDARLSATARLATRPPSLRVRRPTADVLVDLSGPQPRRHLEAVPQAVPR